MKIAQELRRDLGTASTASSERSKDSSGKKSVAAFSAVAKVPAPPKAVSRIAKEFRASTAREDKTAESARKLRMKKNTPETASGIFNKTMGARKSSFKAPLTSSRSRKELEKPKKAQKPSTTLFTAAKPRSQNCSVRKSRVQPASARADVHNLAFSSRQDNPATGSRNANKEAQKAGASINMKTCGTERSSKLKRGEAEIRRAMGLSKAIREQLARGAVFGSTQRTDFVKKLCDAK